MKKNISLLFFKLFIIISVSAQQSQNVTFIHEGKTVYGSFATPEGVGPFSTIIINPGSGASDRDGTFFMDSTPGSNLVCLYPGLLNETLKPYGQLSDAMVEAGYAVLRYDKLEYTYTTPSQLGSITFKKIWLPANSAIDYVKTRADVDTTNIILMGHSEGSTVIPYIAKNRNDVKALVSIAGSRTPLDSLMAYQIMHIAEVCNLDIPSHQEAASQILMYFNIVRSNSWNSNTPLFGGVKASVWNEYIHMADSVSINYNLANLPTLFTGLADDYNVPPSELIRLQNEVTITNDFWSIPDLNHFMTPATDPNVSTVLTDTIIYWLGQHVFPTRINSPSEESFSFAVYPNPFSNEFVIKGEYPRSKNLEVSIRNALGQEIIRESLINTGTGFNHRFSTSSLSKGVYLINIQSDTNRFTKKIIKQ